MYRFTNLHLYINRSIPAHVHPWLPTYMPTVHGSKRGMPTASVLPMWHGTGEGLKIATDMACSFGTQRRQKASMHSSMHDKAMGQ